MKWPWNIPSEITEQKEEPKQIEYKPQTEDKSEQKRTVTCSVCHQQGHNARKCPNKPTEEIS